MEPLRIVDIGGAPEERGEQHGRALSNQIGTLYDRWMSEASSGEKPITERDALGYTLSQLPESRRQAPDLVAEVEGIAEGSGVPFEHVWHLNCFDEAGNYHLIQGLNLARACTSIAATGHSTVDGSTLVAQSWDLDDWYDSILLRIAPGHGEVGALMYTHPGIVGGTGINAFGVAQVWNSMHARDAHCGVPIPFLSRLALRAEKLSDAIPNVLRPVRAIGFNFVIGSEMGAVNIEATARDQRVTYIGRHFAHANHYADPALIPAEGNAVYNGSSFVRSGRMAQLLDQNAGHLDNATMQELLRDHANYPGSICAHPDLPAFGHLTRAAMIYQPAERALHVTDGPPCESAFVKHRVDVAVAV